MFPVEDASHLVSLNSEHGSGCDRSGRTYTDRLTCQASFAEKVSRSQHCDYGFFANLVDHGELHTCLFECTLHA